MGFITAASNYTSAARWNARTMTIRRNSFPNERPYGIGDNGLTTSEEVIRAGEDVVRHRLRDPCELTRQLRYAAVLITIADDEQLRLLAGREKPKIEE